MREELMPSSKRPALARSKPDAVAVRALTARADAIPNDSLYSRPASSWTSPALS
jgi:hypothetical protein